MHISKFQYLTFDIPNFTHAELAKQACEGGCQWIQLRTKNKDFDTWLAIAKSVKKVCDAYNCTLIINDSVKICEAVNADGVHLGKNDISPSEARKILGKNKIIGGTANTFADIENLVNQGVDYVGCGPFQFTKTKQNLSKIVGLAGYEKLVQQMQNANITKPLIAIGGIAANDVNNLLETGVHGIAVSGAIHSNGNITENTSKFVQLFRK